MIEYLTELFVSSLDFIMKAESFYLIESCLIIFGALLLDLSQRKTLASFKIKAEHTKTIWDDVFLGALARPISIIIWISSVSYVADSGAIVKSWTVRDGKVTTHKDEQGGTSGYYHFWSVESGYVQVPIVRSIVEEIKL